MPFFVASKKLNPNEEEGSGTVKHFEISVLANAKRMGLTFMELNLFTMQEFIHFAEAYMGESEVERKATQKDIDRFYAMS